MHLKNSCKSFDADFGHFIPQAVLEVNASVGTTCFSYNVYGLRSEILLSTSFFGYCHSFRYFLPVDFCGISLKQVKTITFIGPCVILIVE